MTLPPQASGWRLSRASRAPRHAAGHCRLLPRLGRSFGRTQLSRWPQLSNSRMSRNIWSYAYPGLVGVFVISLVVWTYPYDVRHQDPITTVGFLIVTAALLNFASVRLDRGRLTLSGSAVGATAILTNPLDAALIGLAVGVGTSTRG